MTLLEEIQTAAVDASSDLGTLLRQCKLLAARLGSQPLEDWLVWESNGYPENVEVPEYRIWPLEVKGHFAGPFGSGLRNVNIPIAFVPKEQRDSYRNYECRQSVASIEAILQKHDRGSLHVTTGDLHVVLGQNVYENQSCIHAWAEFSVGTLVEVLNAVRNRVLDFSLAIWKEDHTAGDVGTEVTSSLESARVTQIFNTVVYGGTANLLGTARESTITFNVTSNDFSSLEGVLRESGVEDEDIQDLRLALETDERPVSQEKFGPRVSAWIAKMAQKAADGSWAVGLGTAGNLLAQAIAKFYGL